MHYKRAIYLCGLPVLSSHKPPSSCRLGNKCYHFLLFSMSLRDDTSTGMYKTLTQPPGKRALSRRLLRVYCCPCRLIMFVRCLHIIVLSFWTQISLNITFDIGFYPVVDIMVSSWRAFQWEVLEQICTCLCVYNIWQVWENGIVC